MEAAVPGTPASREAASQAPVPGSIQAASRTQARSTGIALVTAGRQRPVACRVTPSPIGLVGTAVPDCFCTGRRSGEGTIQGCGTTPGGTATGSASILPSLILQPSGTAALARPAVTETVFRRTRPAAPRPAQASGVQLVAGSKGAEASKGRLTTWRCSI